MNRASRPPSSLNPSPYLNPNQIRLLRIFSARSLTPPKSKAEMQIFAVVEAERWLRARDSTSPYGFIFGVCLLVQVCVPKMFEPIGDEKSATGIPATKTRSQLLVVSAAYFLGEKHASATSNSRLTSEECWCDTRKPRQSGSTRDCAVSMYSGQW